MKETLKKLQRIINVLYKLVPVLINLIEDFADDGKVNKSNTEKPKTNERRTRYTKSGGVL